MKKIVELIRMILGSAAIGFVITAILGGAFLLVSGWWNEPIAIKLTLILFSGFTLLFFNTSIVYASNKTLWDNIYESDNDFAKMIPNLKVFYEVVMFMTSK